MKAVTQPPPKSYLRRLPTIQREADSSESSEQSGSDGVVDEDEYVLEVPQELPGPAPQVPLFHFSLEARLSEFTHMYMCLFFTYIHGQCS